MSAYPTPHINARPEDFARTVLMPGDPLRSKFIAENYLEDARLVNNVRGIQGYTGKYHGVRVSVMASGMGMPSIGIYSYELYNFFGVENIMRIGSAGAMQKDIRVRDIVIGQGACTNSNFAAQYCLEGTFAPHCELRHDARGSRRLRASRCALSRGQSAFVGYLLRRQRRGVGTLAEARRHGC